MWRPLADAVSVAYCRSARPVLSSLRMKTAYELAMERLNRETPVVKLTEEQKAALGELETKYKAKLAEREIFLSNQLAHAQAGGDYAAVEQLERQLASERRVLQSELEEKKEAIRRGA